MDTISSLCERYHVDLAHAGHVAALTTALFDALQPLHQLSPRARELAEAGALLHNVALSIDPANHHTAGRDIIAAAQLAGFTQAERLMLACVAAFHRKAVHAEAEPLFQALNPARQRETLALSALVRIADGLDYSQTQSTRIVSVEMEQTPDATTPIRLRVKGPHSHEDAARAEKKSDLWRALFGPVRVSGRMTRPGLTLDDTLAVAGRRILRYHLDRIDLDDWVLRGSASLSPRLIHRLRVTTRRMRSALRAFGDYYRPKSLRPLAKGLLRLADCLRPLREHDVLVTALEDYAKDFEAGAEALAGVEALMAAWQAEREALRARVAEYLAGPAHAEWIEAMLAFTQTDQHDRPAKLGKPCLLRHAIDAMQAEHLAQVKAFDVMPDLPPVEDLHRLRIAIKRLRYLTDALREVLPAERVEPVLAACIAAQDAFGRVNDAHTAAGAALRFLDAHDLDSRALRSVIAFAEAQQRLIDGQLPGWRAALDPLLVIRCAANVPPYRKA
ncbi:MAG: CHAD domain-containing protein [Anaerolineae bacterium]